MAGSASRMPPGDIRLSAAVVKPWELLAGSEHANNVIRQAVDRCGTAERKFGLNVDSLMGDECVRKGCRQVLKGKHFYSHKQINIPPSREVTYLYNVHARLP